MFGKPDLLPKPVTVTVTIDAEECNVIGELSTWLMPKIESFYLHSDAPFRILRASIYTLMLLSEYRSLDTACGCTS